MILNAVTDYRVAWIVVGAYKVQGCVIFFAKVYEVRNPGVVGGRGATGFKPGIGPLEGPGRSFVELKVLCLIPGPESERIRPPKVWFVSNLEEPLPHLIQTIAADQVIRKLADKPRPFIIVLWRRYIAPVMENRFRAAG